jgi:hypothetical protein
MDICENCVEWELLLTQINEEYKRDIPILAVHVHLRFPQYSPIHWKEKTMRDKSLVI